MQILHCFQDDRGLGLAKVVCYAETPEFWQCGDFESARSRPPSSFSNKPRKRMGHGVFGFHAYAKLNPLRFRGKVRMRFPVAAKMAFATAGRIGGSVGSPNPVGGKLLLLQKISMAGVWRMRSIGCWWMLV